eukprot:Transcript_11044.p1 GENE.Transcript_11044~~Transcript_11044.p1  ORF type:complete len:552 (-),score=252.06 Transcript_11044:150-1589(-)
MTDASSEIADFYPTDFAIDLNGKKFAWQAVVLLPFIDEVRLLEAMADGEGSLNDEERRRNSHGGPVLFVSDQNPLFGPMGSCYGEEPCELLTLEPEAFGADARMLIAGALSPLPDAPPPAEILKVPEFRGIETKDALVDFLNRAVRAAYELPPWQKHATALLPGLTPPPPVLEAHDQPQFGKFLAARRGGGYDASAANRMARGAAGLGGAAPHDGAHGYRRVPGGGEVDEAKINALISRRVLARHARDYSMADRLRDELRREGVELDDGSQCWRVAPGRVGGHGGAPPPQQHGYGGPSRAPPGYPPPPHHWPPAPPGGRPPQPPSYHHGAHRNQPADHRYQPYDRPLPPHAPHQPPPPRGYDDRRGGGIANNQAANLLRQQLGGGGGGPGHYAPPPPHHQPYPPQYGGGGGGGYGGPPPPHHYGGAPPPPQQHLQPMPPHGGGGGHGGPPRGPPPQAGADASANRSAAEILRAQLQGRR